MKIRAQSEDVVLVVKPSGHVEVHSAYIESLPGFTRLDKLRHAARSLADELDRYAAAIDEVDRERRP